MHSAEDYAKLSHGDFMKDRIKGSASLLGATIIWGTAFVAQSVGMDLIGPFTFQTVRCFLAVPILLPIIYLFERNRGCTSAFMERWMDLRLWKVGGICGTALFLAAGLQQLGLVYTDAGKAGFITAMYIVIVPLLGFFLHRKPPKTTAVSVLLAVVGLYLLSCIGVSQINIGDIYLVGCAIMFAVHITVIDQMAAELDGLRLNCIQALVASILSGIVMIFTEKVVPANIVACWLPLCYTGFLSMGVAYSLQIIGQQNMEPTAASLIMSLESVFAVIGGCLILHETMTFWEICGCILVFSGVIISQLPDKK